MSNEVEIKGQVDGVGWFTPKIGTAVEHYASVKILVATTRSQEKAEEKLKELRETLLGKDIIISIRSK